MTQEQLNDFYDVQKYAESRGYILKIAFQAPTINGMPMPSKNLQLIVDKKSWKSVYGDLQDIKLYLGYKVAQNSLGTLIFL